MAKNTELVSLGNGDLYLNGVDVGHLKGTVEFTYTCERVEFKPANMLGKVKLFKISEAAMLKASLAELKLANLKLAMGVTTSIGASQSFPAYDPSSFSPPAGASYDVLTFGGSKAVDTMSLRFEHVRPDTGFKIIVILYSAATNSELLVPFSEDAVILQDLTFEGLALATRAEGDQIGVLVEQVQET